MRLATDADFVDKVPGFFAHEATVYYVKGRHEGGSLHEGMAILTAQHGKVRVICVNEGQALLEHSLRAKDTPKETIHLKKGSVLWISKGEFRETSLDLCRRHAQFPNCLKEVGLPAEPILSVSEEYEMLLTLIQQFLNEPLIHDGEFHRERQDAETLKKDIQHGIQCVEKNAPILSDYSLTYLSERVYTLLRIFREGKDPAKGLSSASD